MKLLSLIAVAIYCGVSLFMAVRLLLLSKRTRELPEFMIGCAYFAAGMIGYPFNVAARVLVEASKPEAAELAMHAGQVGMALGSFFLLLAWRRIFVPVGRGAKAFVVVWTALMSFALWGNLQVLVPGSIDHLKTTIGMTQLVAQGGVYVLLAGSSFRHAIMLKRRCVIGLADPVTADRMFLWGYSNVAITTSYAYALCAGMLLRFDVIDIYNPLLIACMGLTSAFFMTLAFFPPQSYLARVRANAPVAGGA